MGSIRSNGDPEHPRVSNFCVFVSKLVGVESEFGKEWSIIFAGKTMSMDTKLAGLEEYSYVYETGG